MYFARKNVSKLNHLNQLQRVMSCRACDVLQLLRAIARNSLRFAQSRCLERRRVAPIHEVCMDAENVEQSLADWICCKYAHGPGIVKLGLWN